MDRDPSGGTWLPPLLRLGSRSTDRSIPINTGTLLPGHSRCWGKGERRLDPPLTLLQWLVANLSPPASEDRWGGPNAREKRQQLVARDPATIAEALQLLRGPRARRGWYVLEGQSHPDACLETENLFVVIEGKRTEREATTVTTWMHHRSQMLRHMDAAWEIRGSKQVLGLMIVEGGPGLDPYVPNAHWLKEAHRQMLGQALNDSLPHRSPVERAQIADGFLGVATWQRVCKECGLRWPPCDHNG